MNLMTNTRLYSRLEITQAINRMAEYLNEQYEREVNETNPLVFVVVLKGAVPFYVYLSERLTVANVAEFITVKSFDEYTAQRIEGSPIIDMPVEVLANLANRHVVILDDICDSGNTLSLVKAKCVDAHAKSVKAITLFYNNTLPRSDVLSYLCLPTYGNFIYGFGLDSHRGMCRNLRNVYVLPNEETNSGTD